MPECTPDHMITLIPARKQTSQAFNHVEILYLLWHRKQLYMSELLDFI